LTFGISSSRVAVVVARLVVVVVVAAVTGATYPANHPAAAHQRNHRFSLSRMSPTH
jgi:hypothetical protein